MRKFAKTKEAVSKENLKFRTRIAKLLLTSDPFERIILRYPQSANVGNVHRLSVDLLSPSTELTSKSGTDEETIIHSRDHNGKSGRHLVFTSDRPCVLHQPLLLLRHANFLV